MNLIDGMVSYRVLELERFDWSMGEVVKLANWDRPINAATHLKRQYLKAFDNRRLLEQIRFIFSKLILDKLFEILFDYAQSISLPYKRKQLNNIP